MTKGFVDHRADYVAMQERMRASKSMKKVVVRPPEVVDPDYDDPLVSQLRLGAVAPEMVAADEPPDGWDAFLAVDIKKDIKCQMCGEMVAEVRPFGPNHESICAECAAKDPAMTELRMRGLGEL